MVLVVTLLTGLALAALFCWRRGYELVTPAAEYFRGRHDVSHDELPAESRSENGFVMS